MAEEEKDDNTEVETSDAEAASEETNSSTSDAAPPSEDDSAPVASEEQEVEALSPKERRRRERAAKAQDAPARPQRSPEERHAERLAQRRRKAEVRRSERRRRREKARQRSGEGTQPPPRERAPGKQKVRQGVVVSDRAEKTITVRIDVTRRHRRYEKIVRTSNTLRAHDERGDAHTGDTVVVRESRPLSRSKRWRLVEVVERAQ